MTITSLPKLYDHHEFDICSLPLLSIAHVNLFNGSAHLTCMYLNSSQSVYFHSSALLNLFVLVSLKDISSSLVFSFYLQINHTMLLFSLPCNPNPLTNFHRILLLQLYILSMLTHCISIPLSQKRIYKGEIQWVSIDKIYNCRRRMRWELVRGLGLHGRENKSIVWFICK